MTRTGRVFVANRGEIAVRVIRACRELGVGTVLGASTVDRESLAAELADRTVCLGPAPASESYLNVGAVVAAALGTGCDAVHPGYGFLAEHADFAEACEQHGLRFIGPRPETIRQMGDKLRARRLAAEHGVPIVPGSERIGSLTDALGAVEETGYPVMIKAAAGGGGRGMKVVANEKELRDGLQSAAAEAQAAFGDPTLYLERHIGNARHLEVQVLGDLPGNVVHVGDRDCTLQRRHQKVVEEAPATSLPAAVQGNLREAGAHIASRIGYRNAGTVEFVFDRDTDRFYFIEMNTRIQVEHPVTEAVAGLDLVQAQLQLADGLPLPVAQGDVHIAGHAVECRIAAESPAEGFRPSPGRITDWYPPRAPHTRVDTHCYAGYRVPPFYDSLLAKVIAAGKDRAQALQRLRDALAEFEVGGVETTIPFLRQVLDEPHYVSGDVNTRWLTDLLERLPAGSTP